MGEDVNSYDDDTRTIADMTNVGTGLVDRIDEALPSPTGTRERHVPAWGTQRQARDIRDEIGDPEERLMVILGTLKAALSLWLVYVVVFALLIFLLLSVWA